MLLRPQDEGGLDRAQGLLEQRRAEEMTLICGPRDARARLKRHRADLRQRALERRRAVAGNARVGGAVAQRVEEPIARPIHQPIGRPIHQPIGRPIHQPIGRPIHQPIGRPIHHAHSLAGLNVAVRERELKLPLSHEEAIQDIGGELGKREELRLREHRRAAPTPHPAVPSHAVRIPDDDRVRRWWEALPCARERGWLRQRRVLYVDRAAHVCVRRTLVVEPLRRLLIRAEDKNTVARSRVEAAELGHRADEVGLVASVWTGARCGDEERM